MTSVSFSLTGFIQRLFTSNILLLDWMRQCIVVLIGSYLLFHPNILLSSFIFYLCALGTTGANTLLTSNKTYRQILKFSVPYFFPFTKLILTSGKVSNPVSFWRLTTDAVYVLPPKTKDRIHYTYKVILLYCYQAPSVDGQISIWKFVYFL